MTDGNRSTEELVATLEQFPADVLKALRGLSANDLSIPERDGAWSILQVLAHLCDHELQTMWRSRMIVHQDEVRLPTFDQNRWTSSAHRGRDKAALVHELTTLRRLNVLFVAGLTEEELERTAKHDDYGLLTLRGLLQRAIEHGHRHLRQIDRIKATRQFVQREIETDGAVGVAVQSIEPRVAADGIRVRSLWGTEHRHAQLIEMEKGTRFPGIDEHIPGAEEVFVLEGTLQDGINSYPAGTFVHFPAGSAHVPQSETGCRLFLFYPEG